MSELSMILRNRPDFPVDMAEFTPENLKDLTPSAIARKKIHMGNQRMEIGELFNILGHPGTELRINSDSRRLYNIGSDMQWGKLVVEGYAGDNLGAGLAGGDIDISGDTGIRTGTGMLCGTIHISGNAGDLLGAPLHAMRQGMKGGTIHLRGNTGNRAGERMRRGNILIDGDTGDYPGCQMIAGTIAVLGKTGSMVGHGMRRGTLILGQKPGSVPTTFNPTGSWQLVALNLITDYLTKHQPRWKIPTSPASCRQRWVGDLAERGLGEVFQIDL